ncbi:MAG: hypothetical protein WDO06_00140 [Actinomycetota bacterium]
MFLERSGGRDGDSNAQILGSAIHAFAELVVKEPGLTEEDLVGKLTSAWKLIDPSSNWVSKSELERAVTMIRKFVKYHEARNPDSIHAEVHLLFQSAERN